MLALVLRQLRRAPAGNTAPAGNRSGLGPQFTGRPVTGSLLEPALSAKGWARKRATTSRSVLPLMSSTTERVSLGEAPQ